MNRRVTVRIGSGPILAALALVALIAAAIRGWGQ